MSNEELLEQLQHCVGLRVLIKSSVVHHGPAVLQSVDLLDTGVWANFEDNTSMLVGPDDVTIDAEHVEGSRDGRERSEVQREITEAIALAYGPTPEQRRKQCKCPACEHRHEVEELARQAHLEEIQEERYGTSEPEQWQDPSGSADNSSRSNDNSADNSGGPSYVPEGF